MPIGKWRAESTVRPDSLDLSDLTRPDADDILDDLAEMVLAMKGRVVVVPTARMPTKTGVAAIYRY